MGYDPIPTASDIICQYAAFLARSLKHGTIKSYINIIGLMHKEFGLPSPLLDD